jgi:hypothetical protein
MRDHFTSVRMAMRKTKQKQDSDHWVEGRREQLTGKSRKE